jgi:cation transport regulator ChaC
LTVNDEAGRAYFAYGSNMNPGQMAERCPGAVPLGIAELDGYRFVINTRGVATIVPEKRGGVVGVLWAVSEEHERTLDGYEGVASCLYFRDLVNVRTAQGEEIEALVYIAADSGEGSPREGYLERILAGAAHFGLPGEYVEELGKWGPSGAGA